MSNLQVEIAEKLLEIGAVSLRPQAPFTWASGLKSPIYCDNRITMSYPSVRSAIAQGLAARIKVEYPNVEVIAGTATAGIPHAAWVADILELPMIYIRGAAKGHGKGNKIEGNLTSNQKVVIIEDLISTGGSVLEASQAVKEVGAKVLGVAGIFSYELASGIENFRTAQLKLITLTNYSTLIAVALKIDEINANEVKLLQEWKNDPTNWGNKL